VLAGKRGDTSARASGLRRVTEVLSCRQHLLRHKQSRGFVVSLT